MNLRRVVLVFFLIAIGISGLGFSVKLYEFADDLTDKAGVRFAGAHLMTYALVALGFLMLLSLCFVTGQFRDIEEPKHDLLEKERRHDARLPRIS